MAHKSGVGWQRTEAGKKLVSCQAEKWRMLVCQIGLRKSGDHRGSPLPISALGYFG